MRMDKRFADALLTDINNQHKPRHWRWLLPVGRSAVHDLQHVLGQLALTSTNHATFQVGLLNARPDTSVAAMTGYGNN